MRRLILAVILSGVGVSAGYADGWGVYGAETQATNRNGIVNTRHNLTQSFSTMGFLMNSRRNNYGEVCVYCHTPHGANGLVKAPLWNHTRPNPPGGFTLYATPTTLGMPVTQPGPNSLTCLSCHDGVTAIDSVLNMPGPGGYDVNQQISVSAAFLDQWSAQGRGAGPTGTHLNLSQCAGCHSAIGLGAGGNGSENFNAFNIGLGDNTNVTGSNDLRNDHPVGIKYPDSFGSGVDFNSPSISIPGKLAFFERTANGRADDGEIRLYDTGEGYEVECGSCHDPHGVPSAGSGSEFIPSFLRVSNAASALCQTCHVK